ncbi:MAG: response regulator transcription factor [Chloroflexaceae bacterium]
MSLDTKPSRYSTILNPGETDILHHDVHFAVISGLSALAQLYVDRLTRLGSTYTPTAQIIIILDAPHGFALRLMEMPDKFDDTTRCIVATANTCPEYLQDICDTNVHGLLAGDHDFNVMLAALLHVVAGQRYSTMQVDTILTSAERRVLRLLADGHTNKEIATNIFTTHQCVKNTVAALLSKLELYHRHEAMLYYWGLHHSYLTQDEHMGS